MNAVFRLFHGGVGKATRLKSFMPVAMSTSTVTSRAFNPPMRRQSPVQSLSRPLDIAAHARRTITQKLYGCIDKAK